MIIATLCKFSTFKRFSRQQIPKERIVEMKVGIFLMIRDYMHMD